MKRCTILMAAFTSLFLFSGCGQSGPLFIPGNPSQMAVPPEPKAASEEPRKEEQDDGESSETE